jgi:glycerol uptake facilitator-like aquaporin
MLVGLLSDNGEYVRQLWLFWLAPLLGGGLAGMAHKFLLTEKK